jgi:hypothetical protein
MPYEIVEAWDLVCLIVDMDHLLSYIDMVEWRMTAMDMHTAAVWDKLEWSIKAAIRRLKALMLLRLETASPTTVVSILTEASCHNDCRQIVSER